MSAFDFRVSFIGRWALPFSSFKNRFEMCQITMSVEIMNLLSDWLKNHIMRFDKKYSRFFNEKRLRVSA